MIQIVKLIIVDWGVDFFMHQIESYRFARIKVDGEVYNKDLILLPDRIYHRWWRKEGHRVVLEDLEVLEGYDFKYLIIGIGAFGFVKIDDSVKEYCKKKGIELIALTTKKAVEKYNELIKKGEKVIGAFHLTC